jgi:type IV pilus assembly protein PilP
MKNNDASDIDPFKPFIKLTKKTPGPENLLPIQKLKLSEIKLSGIVWNTQTPLALIEDPAGKGYVLKTGDLIGLSGKVKKIKKDRVIIEESYVDIFEGKKTRIVELILPKKEEAILP